MTYCQVGIENIHVDLVNAHADPDIVRCMISRNSKDLDEEYHEIAQLYIKIQDVRVDRGRYPHFVKSILLHWQCRMFDAGSSTSILWRDNTRQDNLHIGITWVESKRKAARETRDRRIVPQRCTLDLHMLKTKYITGYYSCIAKTRRRCPCNAHSFKTPLSLLVERCKSHIRTFLLLLPCRPCRP